MLPMTQCINILLGEIGIDVEETTSIKEKLKIACSEVGVDFEEESKSENGGLKNAILICARNLEIQHKIFKRAREEQTTPGEHTRRRPRNDDVGDVGEDLIKALTPLSLRDYNGDDEDDEDDEDENEYRKDDFVVSDDEDDGVVPRRIDEEELAEFGEETNNEEREEPKLRRLRRNKEQIDEDDLMLVQDAEKDAHGHLHLKAKDTKELENRLFDDDDEEEDFLKSGGGEMDQSGDGQDQKKRIVDTTNDDYFDEDNLDDFIEDDLGDNDGAIEHFRKRKRRSTDGGHQSQGISQLGMQEMMEIFGPEIDEEDDEFFEFIEDGNKQHKKPNQIFEQRELDFHFVSDYDDNIRNVDIPERLQLRPYGVLARRADELDRDLDAEVEFCLFRRGFFPDDVNAMYLDFSEQKIEHNKNAIRATIKLLNKELLEIPCIQYYRRDYLVHSDLALPEDLWGIADLDTVWAQARYGRNKIELVMNQFLDATNANTDPDTDARRELLQAVRYDLRDWSPYDDDAADPDALLTPIKDLYICLRRLVFQSASNKKKKKVLFVGDDDDQNEDVPPETNKKPRINAPETEINARKYGLAFALRPIHVQMKLAGDNCYEKPYTPSENPEMLALEYFANDNSRRRAIYVLARDLAAVPALRRIARRYYRAICVLNTRPTPLGKNEIDAAHEFSGIQHIRRKPIRDILCCGDKLNNPRYAAQIYLHNPAEDFAYMLKAEREGYIQISLAAANVEEDTLAFSTKIADRFNLELMARSIGEDSNPQGDLLDIYLNPILNESMNNDQEEGQISNALEKEWNHERKMIILTAMEKFLLPQFEEEIKILLRKQAEFAIAQAAAAQFKRRINVAPVGRDPYSLDNGTTRDTVAGCTIAAIAFDDSIERRDRRTFAIVFVSGIGLVLDIINIVAHASDRDMNAKKILCNALLKYRPAAIFFTAGLGPKTCFRLEKLTTAALSDAKQKGQDYLDRFYKVNTVDIDDNNDIRDEIFQVLNVDYDGDIDEINLDTWHPYISPAEDSLARAFAYSQRGQREFPNDSPAVRMCISICREAQNAVSEFAACWMSASDDRLVWGDDILKCKFHHLVDDFANGSALMLAYERVLQDMVALIGFDFEYCLNYEHHFGLLIFAPGLGLRKAYHLRRKARQYLARSIDGMIQSRRQLAELVAPSQYLEMDDDDDDDEPEKMDIDDEDLKDDEKKDHAQDDNDSLATPKELVAPKKKKKSSARKRNPQYLSSVVFTNLGGFVRFNAAGGLVGRSGDHDMLDNTRIHPECYLDSTALGARDFAQRICADAFDDIEHYSPDDYHDVIERGMEDSRTHLAALFAAHDEHNIHWGKLEKQPKNNPRPQPFGFPYWRTPVIVKSDDEYIDDKIAGLDIDAYANMIYDQDNQDRKYREQLEDIKRELRWPWRELRPPYQPPSREIIFEWSCGRGASSASTIAYNSISQPFPSLVSPRHQFFALRPLQIVTCRVVSADDFRLYVDITDLPGMRGSIANDVVIEDLDENMTKDEPLIEIYQAIRSSIRKGRIKAPKFLRLDDDQVFAAAVLRVNFDRTKIELSRKDEHVFFPLNKAEFNKQLVDDSTETNTSSTNNAARLYGIDSTQNIEHSSELPMRKNLIDKYLEVHRVAADYIQLAQARRTRALIARQQRRNPKQDNKAAMKNEIKHQRIVHPNYFPKANSYALAEKELANRPEGEAIIRPSSQRGRLTLSWALMPEIIRHIPIEDINDDDDDLLNDGTRRYDTRGVFIEKKSKNNQAQYRIGKLVFEEIDEILALYIYPMNDLIANAITHRKFDAEISKDKKNPKLKVQAKLAQKRQENFNQLHYFVWLDATHPGYLVLSWLPDQGQEPIHEYMECHPKGWRLRDRYCDNVENAINYFKKNVKNWLSKASALKKKKASLQEQQAQLANPSLPPSTTTTTHNDNNIDDDRRIHRYPAAADSRNNYTSPTYSQTSPYIQQSPNYQSSSYNAQTYQPPRYQYNQTNPQYYQSHPPPPSHYQGHEYQQPYHYQSQYYQQGGPPRPAGQAPPPPRGRGRAMTLPAWQQQQQRQY